MSTHSMRATAMHVIDVEITNTLIIICIIPKDINHTSGPLQDSSSVYFATSISCPCHEASQTLGQIEECYYFSL